MRWALVIRGVGWEMKLEAIVVKFACDLVVFEGNCVISQLSFVSFLCKQI